MFFLDRPYLPRVLSYLLYFSSASVLFSAVSGLCSFLICPFNWGRFSYWLMSDLYSLSFLFLAVLGLCCCVWAFSSCSEQGLLFVVVRGLLIAVASLVVEHELQ